MAAPSTTPGLFDSLPEAAAPTTEPARTRFPHLWLCIHLPRLALEALPEQIDGPVVIVDGVDSNSVVYAVNQAAHRHGIYPGAGLNAAYALCPQLQARSRDLRRERQLLDELASWATRFTPWINVERPADLLLEVRGSLQLFGGAGSLCDRIGSGLEAMHHDRLLALAPTPLAALWLSRTGRSIVLTQPQALPGRLGKLSLRYLGWPDKTIAALKGMGVYTVRDCLRLPRAGFARRFGRRYLEELDRALGRLPDPRPSFTTPPQFKKTIEMPAETTDTGQLLIASERLLDELAAYLIARQAGIQNIGLSLLHADFPATRVRVGLLEYCQDSRRLLSLVRLRLESLSLAAPVNALMLSSGKLTTLAGRERSLFAQGPGTAGDWPDLLENLRTKLGVSAVFSINGVADHRPESAWCRVAPRGLSPKGTAPKGDRPRVHREGDSLLWGQSPRPLWLLAQPQRLHTVAGRPDYDGLLVRESGPERIETGWWDGNDVVRDYYVAHNPGGLRLWIYRERRAPRDWYLHGYFG